MTIKTDHILIALTVLAWIIFTGLCIEAGGIITKTIATLTLTPDDAAKFWKQPDLGPVYQYDQSRYVTLATLIIIVVVLKAIMFYVIIRMFHSKKFNLSMPFNITTNRFLLHLGYLSLGIGFFSLWGAKVADRLTQQGVDIPDLRVLKLAGSDVWLFMGVILFVIAFIFKKGIEIQKENELTV